MSQTLLPANSIARWLLILILLAGAYFFYGFLIPVLAALIVGFASWPLYRRLVARCRGRTALAATAALLIVLLVVLTPLTWFLVYSAQEINSGVSWLMEANRQGMPVPDWIRALPVVGPRAAAQWAEFLSPPNGLSHTVQMVSGENIEKIYRWVVGA
ncbi:MAG TPA: hypothetical protein VIS74_02715, partial [Chthoniobacterales bacterium]